MSESGTKAMGSLHSMLLDYVDTARSHDFNGEIACALVEHYYQLKNMSLKEMAELCYVSQASFSRFCRHLGFDNFAEFKEALDGAGYHISDDYSRDFLSQLESGEADALSTYRSQLLDGIRTALNEDNVEVAEHVLDAIDGAQHVVFFSHHFLWHIGRYFQGKMLQMGKFIELPQGYAHQREKASELGPEDCAIICSMNGSYLSHYHAIAHSIFASGAKVVVLAQNRHALYLNRADWVLTCGDSNENDIGKYIALMTIDYLIMSYFRRTQVRKAD